MSDPQDEKIPFVDFVPTGSAIVECAYLDSPDQIPYARGLMRKTEGYWLGYSAATKRLADYLWSGPSENLSQHVRTMQARAELGMAGLPAADSLLDDLETAKADFDKARAEGPDHD